MTISVLVTTAVQPLLKLISTAISVLQGTDVKTNYREVREPAGFNAPLNNT